MLGECRFCSSRALLSKEFVAGNRHAVLGIEVCEVRELVGKFVPQAWVGEDLPVTVALAALHERSDKCMLVMHGKECSAGPLMVGNRKLRGC